MPILPTSFGVLLVTFLFVALNFLSLNIAGQPIVCFANAIGSIQSADTQTRQNIIWPQLSKCYSQAAVLVRLDYRYLVPL